MSEWNIQRLEEVVQVNPTVKLTKGRIYPFIDIDKVSPFLRSVTNEEVKVYGGQSSSKFCNGDTVFSRITPCLENRKIAKVSIEDEAAFGSTEFYIFRAKEGVSDENFVYYLTSSDFVVLPAINSMTGASGRQRADKRFIERLNLNIPDLLTQKRIGEILAKYDDLIENNNKRIKLLEQMAENLYKKWFSYDRIKDLSKTIRLKDIIRILRGLSYSTEEIEVEEGDNLINLKNIQSFGGFKREGTKLYNGKYKKEQIVNYGDLVMGVTDMTQDRRTVGSVALIPKINGVSVISADLIKIDSQIDNSFLYAMFKYGNVSKYISQFANGANVLHLRPQAVLNIKITLPPQDMIDRYVKFVKPLFEEIENLNQHNENLIKQRDMLLPRLMSGKLEIKESQKKDIEFKPKKTFIEFKNSFAAAARKDSGLTEQDMEELYKAYCDDSRDE